MGNVKVGDKVRSLVTQIDVRAGGLYEVKPSMVVMFGSSMTLATTGIWRQMNLKLCL